MEHIVNIVSPQAAEEDAFGCNWDLVDCACPCVALPQQTCRSPQGRSDGCAGSYARSGGTLGRHGMYPATVAWLTLMPSLSAQLGVSERSTGVRAAVSSHIASSGMKR